MAGFVVGIPAGLLDIGTLADLSNIGTLFAFALVAGGVLILRYREPNRHRAFRAPGGPLAPIITILTCLLLMAGLPITNWIRFFVWLAIGLVILLQLRPQAQHPSRRKSGVEDFAMCGRRLPSQLADAGLDVLRFEPVTSQDRRAAATQQLFADIAVG